MKRITSINKWAAIAALGLASSATALAANRPDIDSGVANVLQRFYAQSATHHELADKASAVLVFPRVTKAGAGVGGVNGIGGKINNRTLQKSVLAFVYGENGLIADASLEGAKVSRLGD